MLTGGPGTGKTTAVAGLLGPWPSSPRRAASSLRIALAAPTGKAAARLQQALDTAPSFDPADRARVEGVQAIDPPPAARLDPATAPGSGTTAPTGCPTTSSSSTRPRWCR